MAFEGDWELEWELGLYGFTPWMHPKEKEGEKKRKRVLGNRSETLSLEC